MTKEEKKVDDSFFEMNSNDVETLKEPLEDAFDLTDPVDDLEVLLQKLQCPSCGISCTSPIYQCNQVMQ